VPQHVLEARTAGAEALLTSGLPTVHHSRNRRVVARPGLHSVYVILFEGFEPLDVGGTQTVAALKSDAVQIGLLFSTDPSIRQNGFVPLVDDKHLQNAENITPLIRAEKLNAEVQLLLDAVSAYLSTEKMTELVGEVVIDGRDVAAVATDFLTANGLL
jgi:osmoprotectant transport system substrate-binding protein